MCIPTDACFSKELKISFAVSMTISGEKLSDEKKNKIGREKGEMHVCEISMVRTENRH
jgi:hypothetical protein